MPIPRNTVVWSLAQAKDHLREGDLLLFRGKFSLWDTATWPTLYIQAMTGGLASHIGTLGRCYGEWCDYQTVEGSGVIARSLAWEVKQWPGVITACRPKRRDGYDQSLTPQYIAERLGEPYGYATALRQLQWLAPWSRIRRMRKLHATGDGMDRFDDESKNRDKPDCSALRAEVERLAGHDPFPGLADWAITPADFERSDFYEPVCTLVP